MKGLLDNRVSEKPSLTRPDRLDNTTTTVHSGSEPYPSDSITGFRNGFALAFGIWALVGCLWLLLG